MAGVSPRVGRYRRGELGEWGETWLCWCMGGIVLVAFDGR